MALSENINYHMTLLCTMIFEEFEGIFSLFCPIVLVKCF